MRLLRLSLVVFVLAFGLGNRVSPAVAAEKHAMTLADLPLLKGVSDPQLSPDGRWVAYVVTTTDYDADRKRSEIYLVSTETGQARRLVEGASPRWSPDGGTLAYRAKSGSRNGIWLYDLGSGQSRFLVTVHTTDHFLGHRAMKNFVWSPDGKSIAYVGAEPPSPEPPASDVKVITRILYKTRTGFSDNRRTHIWLVSAGGGTPRLLTPGRYDEHSIDWSPDGGRIVFVSNRSADPDNNYSDDLWTVEVAGGKVTRLTQTAGTEFQPKWSPDGRWIAYLATVRSVNTKDSPAEDTHLYVMPAEGGPSRGLTRNLDRRVWGIAWQAGSRAIYFTASDQGSVPIYRADLKSGRIERLTQGEGQARQYSLDARGRSLAYVRTDLTHPAEVWLADSRGRKPRRLSHANDAFLDQVAAQDADMFWFDSFDMTPVQAWLMKPAGFASGRKFPLILYVHGGPHGMYGYRFSDAMQLLAARGYAVLFINPRGSSGYGQTFSDGTLLNWGGGDYKDLMAGVDTALAKYRWLDRDRMGVIGGSYGGFMTNWILTHTNRFKAAIPVASVSNLISFYGTSLYQLLIEVEFNGYPWDNDALLWQWSPLRYVKNATTPTLLIHGENDHDVPISQAEEMYIALKKRGVETVFVRYPGEGHGVRKPKHRLDYYQRIFAWFDRYVKGEKRTSMR